MDMSESDDTNQVSSSESIERNAHPVVSLLLAAMLCGLGFAWWLWPEPGPDADEAAPEQASDAAVAQPSTTSVLPPAVDSVDADDRTLSAQPPDRCETLVGREPQVTVRTPNPWISCVVVADFQQMVLWNNGTEPMSVDWPGREYEIGVDETVMAGWAGSVFPAGPSTVDSSPYLIPTIWLMPAELSLTADLMVGTDRFGSVVIGMTTDEAVATLGRPLESRPVDGWPVECVFVADDPYSPIFVIEPAVAGSATIAGIIDLKPGGSSAGTVDRCL